MIAGRGGGFRVSRHLFGPRVRRAHLNPFQEIRNHRLGQFAFWWHLKPILLQCVDQQTLGDLARHHGRAGVAPSARAALRIQPQTAFQFIGRLRLRRMALITMLHQYGSDFLLKEFQSYRVRRMK